MMRNLLILFCLFIFGCAESLLLPAGFFSSCNEQGLLSGCSAQASPCGGFSHRGAQALGFVGFSSCSSQAREHRLNSCGSQA